jgi:hypothetical protein
MIRAYTVPTVVHQDPRTPARYLFAAALLGLLLSQPGHALTYLLRYGNQGLALQTQGVHGYFPTLMRLSWVLVGLLVVTSLFVISAGRLALGSALARRRLPGVGPGGLFLVLAIVQLNVYFAQEALEARAVGHALDLPGYLGILGWGLLGQLPLGGLAAFSLSWLSSPLETAIAVLRSPFTIARGLSSNFAPALAPVAWPRPPYAPRLATTYPPAFRKRGPPAQLRLQSL